MADHPAPQIWEAALGQLQIHVTRPNYDTWLKDTVGLGLCADKFTVGAPTEFVKEWLSTRMRGLVTQTVVNILGRPVDVTFEIIGGGCQEPSQHDFPLSSTPAVSVISSPTPRIKVNPKYSFASFVVGASNRLAAAAALAASERPAVDYNPLFIYGRPGLGKTHLLQAIAQHSTGHNHNPLYVTSEQFTNDFVTSLAQGRSDEFRRRYRSLQLLLVDDIQFLAGKERTQEEFFYTFNDLHRNGCQVVLTGDRPPAAIPGLESRLTSRFQGGLIADIQPPDTEMRLAILQSKSQEQKIDLPADVAQFLAERVTDNIRELEGALNRVVAFARLTGARGLTMEVALRALAALTPSTSGPPDPRHVLRSVSTYFDIPLQAISGKTRARPVADARHVAMYLLREDSQLALKQIGLLLGHRDHSTVIHGIQKITHGLLNDPSLARQLVEIRALIAH